MRFLAFPVFGIDHAEAQNLLGDFRRKPLTLVTTGVEYQLAEISINRFRVPQVDNFFEDSRILPRKFARRE